MKKTRILKGIALLSAMIFMAVGTACSSSAPACEHRYTREKAVSATCTEDGKKEAWRCPDCDTLFTNATDNIKVTEEELVIPKLGHTLKKHEASEATCEKKGNIEYYECTVCKTYYSDEAATNKITKTSTAIDKTPHSMIYHPENKATMESQGNIEYWECETCENYYADEAGDKQISLDQTVTTSALLIPDFLVEVEEGREAVILQLTDPQIMPGQGNVETKCYAYIRETINETNPDLILVTGDLIYGKFDHTGAGFVDYIEFMESFEIPWAPVFGNHDNESDKGADWQCDQLEAAEYCLFEQKTLTGNGNYSVGIKQGDELTRVFYMLDSNGCGEASAASLANGHTSTTPGFGNDQVAWFTEQIEEIHADSPDTKISFAYHIQQYVFKDALAQYGFTNRDTENNPINIDKLADKKDGDFGFIGRNMKGAWDTNYAVWNRMKSLGVDSVFVGHEHCNNASVVYEGVRFQFGQKSSTYDRYNSVTVDGEIFVGGYNGSPAGSVPNMGGTVLKMAEDGAITGGYIYYVEETRQALGLGPKIEVNGVNLLGSQLSSGVALKAEAFDESTNAYYITSQVNSGKIYLDIEKAVQNNYLTFSIRLDESGENSATNCFAFRVKPDPTAVSSPQASYDGSKYIWFQLVEDEWMEVTVDISGVGSDCTEFAFMTMAGVKLWIKDVAFA